MRRRTLALAALLAIAACGGDAAGPPPAGAVRITVTWPGASPETVESAPVAPAVEPPAVLPMSRVGGPCVDYHQKSRGDDDPTGVDCFRGEQ